MKRQVWEMINNAAKNNQHAAVWLGRIKTPKPLKPLSPVKACLVCATEKTALEFYVHSNKGRRHYSSYCHECRKISMICRYRKLTRAQYDVLMATNTGACEICQRSIKTPSIDHCHATGKIRGLLCTSCNSALGLMRDDVVVMRRAIEYLERYR